MQGKKERFTRAHMVLAKYIGNDCRIKQKNISPGLAVTFPSTAPMPTSPVPEYIEPSMRRILAHKWHRQLL
jgi:hypothetical protein